MRKVSMKVFLSTMLAMFLASTIPNLISFLIDGDFDPQREDFHYGYVVAFLVSLVVIITVFNFFMNRIIVKRLKQLNDATLEVTKGNYDVYIEDKNKDEITSVINNFNTMISELKANEYQNKNFVRNFSHELKTPLSAIKGYADLIQGSDLSKEEQLEYSKIISTESDRLSELSRNMLLISMVDTQVIIPKQDTFNVAEQIRNVIQLTQLSWESKRLNLDLDLTDISITSNKELLYQVWMNLFSNAVKFTEEGKNIDIKLEVIEEKLYFKIQNDGYIDPEDKYKVFDLFFVSEKSRNKQSSGVGLTLTKKIIEKLKGTIDLITTDETTTFKITLPL